MFAQGGMPLGVAVRCPTPEHGGSLTPRMPWATPAASDGKGNHGGRRARSLRTDIYEWKRRTWTTPKGSPSGPDYARTNRKGSGGDDLVTQTGGQLNPAWVEWLMGFPLGFTDLDVSATLSYPKWLTTLGCESSHT